MVDDEVADDGDVGAQDCNAHHHEDENESLFTHGGSPFGLDWSGHPSGWVAANSLPALVSVHKGV